MAISGVADADILTIANALGEARTRIAFLLNNYSYHPKTCTAADNGGGSHRVNMTLAHLYGDLRIDYGDGTITHATGAASLTPNHTYAGAGTYTIVVTALGFSKTIVQVIA